MKRIISILLALLMLFSAAAFAEVGAASQMNNETVFMQAVALLQYYNQPESIEQARDLFSYLPGSYNQAVYYVMYTQAMIDLNAEDYISALEQFDTLKESNGYASFELSLLTFDLPSCDSLLLYTKARYYDAAGNYSTAYDLYKKADILDSLIRINDLRDYKPTPTPTPKLTPTPQPTPTPAPFINETQNYMYIVNCIEWVSLRASMSISAERLAIVPLGAMVTNVQRVSEVYSFVTYNGMQGYVQNQYLSAYDNPAQNYDSTQKGTAERSMQSNGFFNVYPDYVPFNGKKYDKNQQKSNWCIGDYLFTAGYRTYTVVNCNEYVSLRKEANSDTMAILTVPKSAKVQANGMLNGWMLCRYNGRYGWIKSDYLR